MAANKDPWTEKRRKSVSESNRRRREPGDRVNFNRSFHSYRWSAKARGFEFPLSFEEFRDICLRDCWYCGQPPSKPLRRARDWAPGVLSNGIDRVDNSSGYTIENCVPCCFVCNRAKNTMSVEEFLGWVQRISAHIQSKSSKISS